MLGYVAIVTHIFEFFSFKARRGLQSSVSDSLKFSCGSGSRIPKMSLWIRIQTPHFLFGSGSKGGKKIKENKERKQIFNLIFQNDIKTPLKMSKLKGLKTDPSMFPFLYSPNEPVYFLGFFSSWIRIRICT